MSSHCLTVALSVSLSLSRQAAEPDPSDFQPINRKNHYARRHSVSAERYDPEADDDDDDVRVIHPKSDEKRRRLIDAVQDILIFRCLEAEQMGDVIDAMFERRVAPGEHVITQGDDGDNFYVIETGTYDVLVTSPGASTPSKIHQFAEHGSFGELALMYNMPRSATVVALNGGTLWAMDRASFRRIILKSAFKKRKMYELLLQVGQSQLQSEHAHTHARTHARTHAHTHARTYTRIYTHACAHAYIFMHLARTHADVHIHASCIHGDTHTHAV